MHTHVFDNVQQLQFYQKIKGEVVLRVVKSETYSEQDTIQINKELSEKLGNDMELSIEFVDKISRTGRGKYKFLIQKLQIDKGNH